MLQLIVLVGVQELVVGVAGNTRHGGSEVKTRMSHVERHVVKCQEKGAS